MRKMDGRLKPADNIEKSTAIGKKFKCVGCGEEVYFRFVEFSEVKSCPECGKEMHEDL